MKLDRNAMQFKSNLSKFHNLYAVSSLMCTLCDTHTTSVCTHMHMMCVYMCMYVCDIHKESCFLVYYSRTYLRWSLC